MGLKGSSDVKTFQKRYKKIRKLGAGSFGKVYLAERREDRKKVVVKVMDFSKMNEKEYKSCLNEIKVMEMLSHKYTVDIYDHLTLDQSVSIVMQYCSGTFSCATRDDSGT